MPLELSPYTDADHDTLRELVEHPSLGVQFDVLHGEHGLHHLFADGKFARDALFLARLDGRPAGFTIVFRIDTPEERWVMARAGVIGPCRRRGVGRALADAVIAHESARRDPRPLSISTASWMPDEGATALAASLGFEHERWFWRMDRPRGDVAAPVWPDGVRLRSYDASEAMLAEWTDTYNDSFAKHFRFTPSSVDDARALVSVEGFRADGLLLAYRGDRALGFAFNKFHESRGELATLGTRVEARGLGLGRALLRWSVRWLQDNGPGPVTLLVDGENENALGLYRSEGFEVTLTRRVWNRRFPANP